MTTLGLFRGVVRDFLGYGNSAPDVDPSQTFYRRNLPRAPLDDKADALTTQVMTRQVVMTLNEDPAGNLGGLFCQSDSPAFPAFCQPLLGKVQSNGAVQMEFGTGGGASFKLNGGITGSMTCVDGSTGVIIAGTFQVREGLGTFSLNSCRA